MTNIFSYNGRIGRLNFILTFVGACFLMAIVNSWDDSFLTFIVWSILTWILICASIKRFHDIGNSGIYAFLLLIPFAPVYVACLKGNVGLNHYGADPLRRKNTTDKYEQTEPLNASEHIKSMFTYKKVFDQDDKKEVKISDIKYCRQCGEGQPRRSIFCSSCGKSFS